MLPVDGEAATLSPPPESRAADPMPIHFFTFRASPTSEAKEFEKAGGAYNCWIESGSREEAE